ncbi:MAG: GGDEF domain-containing protein [Spirochaetia bacterium]|nr:GGDEF domain-containing protein [Spirochaetia bacterium]
MSTVIIRMGIRQSFLASFFNQIRWNTDPMARDIGQAGELLTARLRLVVIGILAINPIKSAIVSPTEPSNWIGLAVTFVAFLMIYLMARLAARRRPPRSLPWITSQLDVLYITVASVGFILGGQPLIAVNSFVHWSYYLLAIGATCLRHDPRLTIAATVAASVQQLLLGTYVFFKFPGITSAMYGFFVWDDQIGRVIAMIVMGTLACAIVIRNRQVWEMSVRDKLTGLHNRRFFDEFLEFKIIEFRREKTPLCLALLDADFFKRINDVHGHDAGDEVLIELGQRIAESFRSSDLVARWGGEEFAVVLARADLRAAYARLRVFQEELAKRPIKFGVTVSIGVACFPEDSDSPESLFKVADENLLKAKRGGRNTIVALNGM